jgi:hypothetical protein
MLKESGGDCTPRFLNVADIVEIVDPKAMTASFDGDCNKKA